MSVEWKKALRTSLQVLLSLLLASPAILPALGLSATAGIGVTVVALSGILARLMSLPQLIPLFEKLGLHVDNSL